MWSCAGSRRSAVRLSTDPGSIQSDAQRSYFEAQIERVQERQAAARDQRDEEAWATATVCSRLAHGREYEFQKVERTQRAEARAEAQESPSDVRLIKEIRSLKKHEKGFQVPTTVQGTLAKFLVVGNVSELPGCARAAVDAVDGVPRGQPRVPDRQSIEYSHPGRTLSAVDSGVGTGSRHPLRERVPVASSGGGRHAVYVPAPGSVGPDTFNPQLATTTCKLCRYLLSLNEI